VARRVSARFSAPFALLTADPTRVPLDAPVGPAARAPRAHLWRLRDSEIRKTSVTRGERNLEAQARAGEVTRISARVIPRGPWRLEGFRG